WPRSCRVELAEPAFARQRRPSWTQQLQRLCKLLNRLIRTCCRIFPELVVRHSIHLGWTSPSREHLPNASYGPKRQFSRKLQDVKSIDRASPPYVGRGDSTTRSAWKTWRGSNAQHSLLLWHFARQ